MTRPLKHAPARPPHTAAQAATYGGQGASLVHTVERLRGEFLEMPGLRLSVIQVQRLCGVERSLCKAVLNALVEEKFLQQRADGTYARLTESEPLTHRPGSRRNS